MSGFARAKSNPNQKGLSLLFYVVMHCAKAKPSCLTELPECLPLLEKAVAYPIEELEFDVAVIQKDMMQVRSVFAAEAAACKNPADGWSAVINRLKDQGDLGVARLQDLTLELQEMTK
jgi:hypothetical protein